MTVAVNACAECLSSLRAWYLPNLVWHNTSMYLTSFQRVWGGSLFRGLGWQGTCTAGSDKHGKCPRVLLSCKKNLMQQQQLYVRHAHTRHTCYMPALK
jgi:hypothetical protein